jgi:hypothetical protein
LVADIFAVVRKRRHLPNVLIGFLFVVSKRYTVKKLLGSATWLFLNAFVVAFLIQGFIWF